VAAFCTPGEAEAMGVVHEPIEDGVILCPPSRWASRLFQRRERLAEFHQ
jgi:hypothetical protein